MTDNTEDAEKMRFSDPELRELREDFRELSRQFDDHIKQYDEHIRKYSEDIKQLCRSVDLLRGETRDIVKFSNDVKGTMRIGVSVQNFGMFLLKWGVIGAGLYNILMWILAHLPGQPGGP